MLHVATANNLHAFYGKMSVLSFTEKLFESRIKFRVRTIYLRKSPKKKKKLPILGIEPRIFSLFKFSNAYE